MWGVDWTSWAIRSPLDLQQKIELNNTKKTRVKLNYYLNDGSKIPKFLLGPTSSDYLSKQLFVQQLIAKN